MKSLGLQDLVLLSSSTAALSSAVVSRGHTTALVLPVLSTGRLARQLHHVSSSAGRAVRMSSSFRTSKAEFKTLVAPLEYEEVCVNSSNYVMSCRGGGVQVMIVQGDEWPHGIN